MVRRSRGTWRRTGGLLAALCAGASAVGLAAPHVWAAEKPHPYATAQDAKSVSGTASSSDAPTVGNGLFTDRIKAGQEKYYALDLDDSSDVHVAATLAPGPGTKVTYDDGVEVTLENTDDVSCGEDDASIAGDTAFPVTAYAARLIGDTDDDSCREKGPYLIHVVRKEGSSSDPSAWPLELSVMTEPGLKGSIPEPRPGTDEETDDNNTRPTPPSGTAKAVEGGTGFNDARAVGKGVWKDRLQAGETRWFRVPVDWNQRLYARMEVPNSTAKKDGSTRYVSNGFRLNLYNPARGPLYDSEEFQSYDGGGADFDRYTNPVRYENRYADDASATRFAGWYYVAVTAGPEMAQGFPKGTPVTLRVAVKGTPGPGPKYDGDAKAAGFGVSDEDRDMAAKGLTEVEAETNATLRTVGWSGIGTGAGLVAVLAAWTLIARRRTAPAATGGAGPWPPRQPGTPGTPLPRQEPTQPYTQPHQPYGGPPQG